MALDITDAQLVAAAKAMLERSYAPYSHFAVGAALLGADGHIYTGCNMECASYGATICAERSALCCAVSAGCRRFLRLAVISRDEGFCTPCGICRQMLWEFSPELIVLCCKQDGRFEAIPLRELLPRAFSL